MASYVPSADEQFVLDQTAKGQIADFTARASYDENAKPSLRADFIRTLLLGLEKEWRVAMPGIRVKGARLDGRLDLSDCAGPLGGLAALALDACDLPEDIDISGAHLARFSIEQSRFRAILGNGAEVDGDFSFTGATPLPGAGGSEGSAYIRLRAARIGGDVWGRCAHLRAPIFWPPDIHPSVFYAQAAQIGGNVLLDDGAKFEGQVWLLGAKIEGALSCGGGRFINPGGDALVAASAEIGGGALLRCEGVNRFEAYGGVNLFGAKIAGTVDFDGAYVANEGGYAIIGTNAEIRGGIRMGSNGAHPFEAAGEVSLLGAKITGNLECAGGRFINGRGAALVLSNAEIGGTAFVCAMATHTFEAEGQVSFLGARISGSLDCSGARMQAIGGRALSADNVQVGGAVLLRAAGQYIFEAQGHVSFLGAKMNGNLECTGARFLNPGGFALGAENAEIGGAVLLRANAGQPFEANGAVSLLGAKIERDLDMRDGKFSNPSGYAIVLKTTRIGGELFARDNEVDGIVSLESARIGRLFDDPDTAWGAASSIALSECVYEHLGAQTTALRPLWRRRAVWLRRATPKNGAFANQPWRVCSAALERAGLHPDARRLSREEKREENRHRGRVSQIYAKWMSVSDRSAVNRFFQAKERYDAARAKGEDGDLNDLFASTSWWLFFVNWLRLLAWPVLKLYCMAKQVAVFLFAELPFGYGLSASRAAVSAGLFWLAGSVGTSLALERGALIEEHDGAIAVCDEVLPPLYALDVAAPVIDLGQEKECKIGRAPGAKPWPGIKLPDSDQNLFEETGLWRWAQAAYAALGAIVIGFSILTWTGVFKPKTTRD